MPSVVVDPDPSVVIKEIPRQQWIDQHKAKVLINAKAKYLKVEVALE